MPAITRAIDRADQLTDRQLRDAGDEFRERRLVLGVSQEHVARACRISRNHYGKIENGRAKVATLAEINRIAVVLGLVASLRLYPSGPPVRDGGHARRLQGFLADVRPPLSFRLEVALPRSDTHPEWRAWDATLFGRDARTAIELEMRLRDVQAMRRRVDLKRRDDPTQSFLLLIADTRTNRPRACRIPRAIRGSSAAPTESRSVPSRSREASSDGPLADQGPRSPMTCASDPGR